MCYTHMDKTADTRTMARTYPNMFLFMVVSIPRIFCNHIKKMKKASPVKSQGRLMVQVLPACLQRWIIQWAKYSLSWSKEVQFAYCTPAVMNSPWNLEEQCGVSFPLEKAYLTITLLCFSGHFGQCDSPQVWSTKELVK